METGVRGVLDVLVEWDLEGKSGMMPSEGQGQEGGAGRHDSIRRVGVGWGWGGQVGHDDREGEGVGLHDAVRWATEWTQVHTVLHIVLLQLGQDVFSISVLPQGGDMGPDLSRDRNTDVSLFTVQNTPRPGCIKKKKKIFRQHQTATPEINDYISSSQFLCRCHGNH